ncbi:hypothetical protein EGT74_13265 [Chitinophaga lutea]|uniref:AraC family transcriptional regulator n=1 Tax=Chitinophaga lutea TaxID=2488634 RepID=A0A3N4PV59_9BACT|nr:hypothetical protein [Chitinophaga lutea]RPE08037.1 hypothetical protein EGT74_13265 [Chitinophaga lutea]
MKIIKHTFEAAIPTVYVEAASFPEGIRPAFDELCGGLKMQGRTLYGVTERMNGKWVYRACATDLGDNPQLPRYNIPAGKYLAYVLPDWEKHMPMIGQYFEWLLEHPDAKADTIALEYYKTMDEVWLMVQHK